MEGDEGRGVRRKNGIDGKGFDGKGQTEWIMDVGKSKGHIIVYILICYLTGKDNSFKKSAKNFLSTYTCCVHLYDVIQWRRKKWSKFGILMAFFP